ncbi:ROK family transcriptional regulator [Tessaracoccus oleiagri]|uniref:Sugar kinase of the NBD/HSP70 family, may contain an N-terminal HTH domain n=1 Tax=Tessaracoccus oleiagri TaxID=686624 RepID=A0A1G9HL95_9ACTN|nr:ROK family transcriptional regulator [Tessaracoccus oleiagri]SDL13655.1 Sugar kinase of the NBD/HSP70 family, may contain an N-terminal HTH domain [Tessaracoccus oleiagri]
MSAERPVRRQRDVLATILAHGPTSRSDVAKMLGLTQASAAKLVSELIEEGLIREGAAEPKGGRGRPRIPLHVIPDAWQIIALRIGPIQVTTTLVNLAGEVLESHREVHGGGQRALDVAFQGIERMQAAATARILGLGAIAGGWVEPATGVVRRFNDLSWWDVPLRDILREKVDVPVHVDSVVRAHANGDLVYGRAKGAPDFLHVFIGQLLQVAQVAESRVLVGPSGYGGDLSGWLVGDLDGTAHRAEGVLKDSVVLARAVQRGVIDPSGTYDDLTQIALEPGARGHAANRLLIERARLAGRLVADVAGFFSAQDVVVSSGVTATPQSIDALVNEFETRLVGLPRPRLHIDPDWRVPIGNSAAAMVVQRELLAPVPDEETSKDLES